MNVRGLEVSEKVHKWEVDTMNMRFGWQWLLAAAVLIASPVSELQAQLSRCFPVAHGDSKDIRRSGVLLDHHCDRDLCVR